MFLSYTAHDFFIFFTFIGDVRTELFDRLRKTSVNYLLNHSVDLLVENIVTFTRVTCSPSNDFK